MQSICDQNEYDGTRMFSKEGRKLNQFFINLPKSNQASQKVAIKTSNPVEFSIKTSQLSKSSSQLNKIKELKTKTVEEPFKLIQGREYYQKLELRKIEPVNFSNFISVISKSKVKILRNYNLENQNDQLNSRASKFPEKHNKENEHICPKFKQDSVQTTLIVDKKIKGMIQFVKQKNRPELILPIFNYKNELNPIAAIDKIKNNSGNTLIDFFKTRRRTSPQTTHSFQRNNYALNPKRELVEPRNEKNIPDFSKSLERKLFNTKMSCLNREFYDYKLPKMHISSPNYDFLRSGNCRSKSFCFSIGWK